jgi:hypothetical protein
LRSVVDDALRMAGMVAGALESSGYLADFSPQSLWEIDRFFDEQSRKGQPRRWGLLASETSLRLFAIGAYVGEVIRRDVGGDWEGDESDDEPELNIALRLSDGRVLWPVQRAVKRLTGGKGEAIVDYATDAGVDVGAKPKPNRNKRPEK